MSKKFIYTSVACAAVAVAWMGTSVPSAQAFPQFKVAFLKQYVKADSTDDKDVAFKEAAEKASCAICHDAKNKKVRNAYGKALEQYITPANKANVAKIKAALEKAANDHSIPNDEKSPTFGEKIADHKLPASN